MTISPELLTDPFSVGSWKATKWIRQQANIARTRLNLPPHQYPDEAQADTEASHNQ